MGNVVVRAGVVVGAALAVIAGTAGAQIPRAAPAVRPGLPADIAVAPEVAEVRVAVIYNPVAEGGRFDLDGRLLAGLRLPLLKGPIDVAYNGRTGDLYTVRMWQGNLHSDHYTAANALDRQWETGFTASPVGLTVDDRTGMVSTLLATPGASDVQVDLLGFTASGALQDSWSAAVPVAPIAFARDVDLATYIVSGDGAGGGQLRKFGAGGVARGEWVLDARPLAIAVGADDVFVAGMSTGSAERVVRRFGRDGEARGDWWLGGVPLAIEVGPDDLVYVLVQRSGGLDLAVEKYTPDGRLLLRWVVLARAYLPRVVRGT